MTKRMVFGVVLALTLGCTADPMKRERAGVNGDVKVDLLFVHDGVKMYRFYDGNDGPHYYAVPVQPGERIETTRTYTECHPCGNNHQCCSEKQESVSTLAELSR